jgi:hypothetical protein
MRSVLAAEEDRKKAKEASTAASAQQTSKNGSKQAKTSNKVAPVPVASESDDAAALAAALDRKDRLLTYERQHVQRTRIYDDQEDFYDADTWLSPEERKQRKELALKAKQEAEVARRQIHVTIDLAGRTVHSTGLCGAFLFLFFCFVFLQCSVCVCVCVCVCEFCVHMYLCMCMCVCVCVCMRCPFVCECVCMC